MIGETRTTYLEVAYLWVEAYGRVSLLYLDFKSHIDGASWSNSENYSHERCRDNSCIMDIVKPE